MISRKDLLKTALGGADLTKMPVTVIMTRLPHIITINQEEHMLEAAQKIIDHEVDALPVVKELPGAG